MTLATKKLVASEGKMDYFNIHKGKRCIAYYVPNKTADRLVRIINANEKEKESIYNRMYYLSRKQKQA